MKIKFSRSIRYKRKIYAVCMIAYSLIILVFENTLANCINDFEGRRAVLAIFFLALASLLSWLSNDLEEKIKKEAMFEIQSDWVCGALTSSSCKESGESLFQYTEDVYEMAPWYAIGEIKKYLEIVTIVLLAVYMTTINFILTALAFVFFGIGLLFSKSISQVFGNVRNQKQTKNARLNQSLIEIIKNLSTIIQLGKKSYFTTYFDSKIDEEYDSSFLKKMINTQAGYISQMVFVQEIIPVILLFIGLTLAVHKKATIGGVIVLVDLASRLSQNVQNVAELLPDKETAQRIRERIEPKPLRKYEKTDLENFRSMKIDIDRFNYEKSQNILLNNIHFMIRPKEIWQIEGASGSGKSTLFQLISRRNEESTFEGQITYNQENIRSIAPKAYYQKVLCVEQEPSLFQGTIMENITFGKSYPVQKIEEVMKICGLDALIKEKGEDTLIENNGKNLSGGQKQRIALARMLIRNPEILLIDEGLSGIHKDLRRQIVHDLAFYGRKSGMAILVISYDHEFDEVVDHVVKIEGGKDETLSS